MDLKEFYFQNIKESEYHYRFFNYVRDAINMPSAFCEKAETQDCQFEIYDAEDAITKFKELCQPGVDFSVENKCWFYLTTYYLYTLGYEIKEFPLVLARPPVDPANFDLSVSYYTTTKPPFQPQTLTSPILQGLTPPLVCSAHTQLPQKAGCNRKQV